MTLLIESLLILMLSYGAGVAIGWILWGRRQV